MPLSGRSHGSGGLCLGCAALDRGGSDALGRALGAGVAQSRARNQDVADFQTCQIRLVV
jgi:hypothetical protein